MSTSATICTVACMNTSYERVLVEIQELAGGKANVPVSTDTVAKRLHLSLSEVNAALVLLHATGVLVPVRNGCVLTG